MANWITHMMIADRLLERIPGLDRTGFCVGSIAPDCNIENKDWSAFTPPREVTHWMSGEKKTAVDCERFYECRIAGRIFETEQERSFYLGYYAHLVTDAIFQRFIRDEQRVKAMMMRIHARPEMAEKMHGLPQDFDGVKMAFGKRVRMRDIEQMEYEYLRDNPQSGYLTELRTLQEFPDYPEYLPEGAIMRKIGIMAGLPETVTDADFVFFSREEYRGFLDKTAGTLLPRICR
jgi:hypothetical protein